MAQKSTTAVVGNSSSHEEPPVQVLNKHENRSSSSCTQKLKILGFHCGSGSGSKIWTQFQFQVLQTGTRTDDCNRVPTQHLLAGWFWVLWVPPIFN